MAFKITQDGAKVVMPFSALGFNWTVILWFKKGDFDETDMVTLADFVQAKFYGALDTVLGLDVTYGPPTVYDMRSVDGAVVSGTDDPEGGEGTGNLMPPGDCCVLTLRTAKRGRSHRGRMYLAGFTETGHSGGSWGSTVYQAAEALGTAILADQAATGWTWGVRSGQIDGVERENGIITPITSTEVRSPIVCSQRRRDARP